MADILNTGLFSVFITLGMYQLAVMLQKKTKLAILNPIFVATIFILILLQVTGIENADYQAGCKVFSWLLTPATVCFAVPMYEQLRTLKNSMPAIIIGILAGTVSCLVILAIGFSAFSFDRTLAVSLLPKSITTAMGIALTEMNDGIPALTTAAIVITGVMGSILGSWFCKVFQISDPVAQGVAFGTASHVAGTARASEIDSLTGAVSSFSLVVAGLLTAVLFPLFVNICC